MRIRPSVLSGYVDEISKFATRSHIKDLLAGVEPSGVITFGYGAKDVPRSHKEQRHSRALGTIGGLVGGAITVPAAISGLMGLGSGLRNIRKGGLRGVGRAAWRGLKAPIVEPIRAMRLRSAIKNVGKGMELKPSQSRLITKYIREYESKLPNKELAQMAEEFGRMSHKEKSKIIEKMGPAARKKLRGIIGKRLESGLSALGLAGGVSGTSAYYQYGAGRRLGKMLTPEQREKL